MSEINRLIRDAELEQRRLDAEEGQGLTVAQTMQGIQNYDGTGINAMKMLVDSYQVNPTDSTYDEAVKGINRIGFIDQRQNEIKTSVLGNLKSMHNAQKNARNLSRTIIGLESADEHEGISESIGAINDYLKEAPALSISQSLTLGNAISNRKQYAEAVYDSPEIMEAIFGDTHKLPDGSIDTQKLLSELSQGARTTKQVGSPGKEYTVRDFDPDNIAPTMKLAIDFNNELAKTNAKLSKIDIEKYEEGLNKNAKKYFGRLKNVQERGEVKVRNLEPTFKDLDWADYSQIADEFLPFFQVSMPKPNEDKYGEFDTEQGYVNSLRALDAFGRLLLDTRIPGMQAPDNIRGTLENQQFLQDFTNLRSDRHVEQTEELIKRIDEVLATVDNSDASAGYKSVFYDIVDMVHLYQDIGFDPRGNEMFDNTPWNIDGMIKPSRIGKKFNVDPLPAKKQIIDKAFHWEPY